MTDEKKYNFRDEPRYVLMAADAFKLADLAFEDAETAFDVFWHNEKGNDWPHLFLALMQTKHALAIAQESLKYYAYWDERCGKAFDEAINKYRKEKEDECLR